MNVVLDYFKKIPVFPHLFTVPLLLAALGCAIPINGTDDIMFGPAMLTYIAFVVFAMAPLFFKEITLPKSSVIFWVIGFFAWTLVSLQWSKVPYVSTFFVLSISTLPIIFLVMVMQPKRDQWIPLHLGAIGIAMIGAAVWAWIQFLFMFDTHGPRIKDPMLNPNNLAAFFNLGLLPSIGLYLLSSERRTKIISLLLVALFLGGMLVTQSKGAMLAFFISAIVLVTVSAWKQPMGKPQFIKYGILAGVVLVMYFLVDILSKGNLNQSITILSGIADTHTAHNRIDMWKSTFAMIQDNFWVGIGLGTFYFFYPPYRTQMDTSDGFFVHMDPLQFWLEMGFIAPIMFYGTLIAVLIRTIRALKSVPAGSPAALHIMAPFCGLLAVLGHTHITFNLYMPPILITIACLLAYWFRATEIVLQDEDNRFRWSWPSKPKKVAALCGFVVFSLFIAVYPVRVMWAIHHSYHAQLAANENRHEDSRQHVKALGKFAPDSFARYYEFKSRLHISLLMRQAKSMSLADRRYHFDEANKYLDAAEERNPGYWQVKNLRAKLYQAVDDLLIVDGQEQAFELLKYNVEYNKLDVDSRMDLAQLLDQAGQTADALRVMQAGVTWPRPRGQKDLQFLILLAEYYRKTGNQQVYENLLAEIQKRSKEYGIKIQINYNKDAAAASQ